ncbi:MAG: hypothetical protein K2X27_01720 [Candidatus Obscuribacterales bacterium]|nr:hypothetical protein [Candidatus Obscuribacterales bacterium]
MFRRLCFSLLFLSTQSLISVLAAEPLQGNVKHEDITPLSGDLYEDGDRELLPAGVAFSDTVPPVSSELKLHKLFSSISLPSEDKEDTWYQIPKWRAGLYHREKQIDHTKFGDRESVSKVDHLYGMQVDKNGGIWHHMSWPRITKLSLEGYSQYKIINKYEPISLKGNEYCVKISSTNVDVDDKTGKIIRLGKQEEFDWYYPAGAGVARGKCLIKGFSNYGRTNTEIERCSVEERLIQPFSVLNSFRGKNLRESFKQYLLSHDLADLVPPDPSAVESGK